MLSIYTHPSPWLLVWVLENSCFKAASISRTKDDPPPFFYSNYVHESHVGVNSAFVLKQASWKTEADCLLLSICGSKNLTLAFVLQKLLMDRYMLALFYRLRHGMHREWSTSPFSERKKKISVMQGDLTWEECTSDREQRWLPSGGNTICFRKLLHYFWMI